MNDPSAYPIGQVKSWDVVDEGELYCVGGIGFIPVQSIDTTPTGIWATHSSTGGRFFRPWSSVAFLTVTRTHQVDYKEDGSF
jgi:hypothetical protein|tara:strand:+ start:577 stop:822 length:246 start_codon:yes stop_codon:yes gene_type:complete